MTNLTLLDRLRQADPDTWEKIRKLEWSIPKTAFCPLIDWKDRYAELQDAWLQHVLHEAIHTQKWHLLQSQDPSTRVYYVEISKIAPGYAGDRYTEHCLWLIGSGKDNSSENALLKAYLVAIES